MRPTFDDFLNVFPEISLPATLTDSLHHELERANLPFAQALLLEFIVPTDEGKIDEFTEYMPAFKITKGETFAAVVFWKAGLMVYEYILATFNPKGLLIATEVIFKNEAANGKLSEAVTVITPEWMVYVAEATHGVDDEFDPSKAVNYSFEVLPNGEIVKYGKQEL